MKKRSLEFLVERLGKKYSEILDIDLSNGKEEEIFKWFLASILFGAPIMENSVIKTFKCFQKYKVLSPEKILQTGWDGLVKILDEGSYTRYDFKTADKLLEVMKNLEKYYGSLVLLYNEASDAHDLERRLKELGKGIGDVTVSIFLRELRDIWQKANPKPTSLVVLAAKKLGIVKEESPKNVLGQLENFWLENKIAGKSFVNLEAALLRVGKNFCRKKKCAVCPIKDECLAHEAP